MIRRLLATAGLGIAAALLAAAPAAAHSGETATSTPFHSRLVAVSPRVPGGDLRLVGHGTHVELVRDGAREVVALGYLGEPYVKITADGVYANTESPTAYTNGTLPAKTAPADVRAIASPEPDTLGAAPPPTAPVPHWTRIGGGDTVRWHDHRTHWIATALPPAAAADPGRSHRIANWRIGLLIDGKPATATGTLDYLPPPKPSLWWAGLLIAAAAVAVLGRWSRAIPLLGAVLAVAAVGALAEGTGRVLDAGEPVLTGLVVTDTYGTLTALGALAAAWLAVRRRPVAPFALALAGVCLAVMAGLTRADVFGLGGAPVPWPPLLSRLAVAGALAAGAGVAGAGWLRLRAERPVTAPAG